MIRSPRQPLAALALCAVLGIVLADGLPAGTIAAAWKWAAAAGAFSLGAPAVFRKLRGAMPLWAGAAAVLLFFAWHGARLALGPDARLAALLPAEGRVVQAVGIVDEEPAPGRPLRVRLETVTLGMQTFSSGALVRVRWMGELPRYGDRVQIDGDLHRLAPPRNPGVFDGPRTWRRQGIAAQLIVRYPGDTRVLERGRGSPFIAAACALRHGMERTLALDLDDSPEITGVIQSMVLGSRGDSLAETRALFQATGTLHLFAVSGLNVAMLAGICAWVMQTAGVGRHARVLILIPLLWVYAYATGLSASSLRATVMASVYLGGVLLDRRALSWNTLGVAALILLAWAPEQLFAAGFQLSFGVSACLMALAWRTERLFDPLIRPDPFLPRQLWSRGVVFRHRSLRLVTGAFSVSAIAWIGSAPLTAAYFHLWSPSTLPANLFAALLAWIMMTLGFASVIAGAFWSGLAVVFNNANWLVAKVLLWGIAALASVPGGHLYVAAPAFERAPLCEIEVLDLPGGGAAHVRVNRGGRRDWMIDCGGAFAFRSAVAPYLHSRGVNRLDGLVLTHGDAQHLGGAVDLLEMFDPGEVVDSPLRDRSPRRKAVHAALEQAGRGKSIVRRGDTLTLAPGVTLQVLFPPEGLRAGPADDKALVLRLDAGGKRVLFTSDAGFLTERWLLENALPGELRCDVLVKQIHAKDFSGTPDFLAAVRPEVIVASSTAFPPQEKISGEWAGQVAAAGIRLLRQDETGAVRLILRSGGAWQAEPFLPAAP